MGVEIDFLAVGDESKSGDAIALRYGDLSGPREAQTIVIIDGGFADTGPKLVRLVRERYGTGHADIVISTHPDNDHVAGLVPVVEQMTVGELWLHRPWNHSQSLAKAASTRFSATGLSEYMAKSLSKAQELEEAAESRGVDIVEPFAGTTSRDAQLRVMGPSREYYSILAPQFPEQASGPSLMTKAREAGRGLLPETPQLEQLTEDGETSPQNESSVVALLETEGKRFLFTGDAGLEALNQVIEKLAHEGLTAGGLRFVQVPHHGSQRNVSPWLLDRLLGPKGTDALVGTGFVSAAPQGQPKHPNKKVTNAFHRRGYRVHATRGENKWHHHNAPLRPDYGPSEPLPFYDQVEEEEP